jgi:hypothetical protein
MPKRSSKSPDPNKRAFQVVREATADQPDKNPAAVALGKLGGKKGGPKKRKEIARKAAQARWKNNEG